MQIFILNYFFIYNFKIIRLLLIKTLETNKIVNIFMVLKNKMINIFKF
jgi:hypothetical protein